MTEENKFITDREMAILGAVQNVVCAYISGNSLPKGDLPELISSVHQQIVSLVDGAAPAAVEPVADLPTQAQVRKSITPDALISFIDGKPYKTLKRHLTKHGLDIAGYRQRYGLPADYPTTSANYSAQRSALAKSLGLGQGGRTAPAAPPAKPATKAKAPLAA